MAVVTPIRRSAVHPTNLQSAKPHAEADRGLFPAARVLLIALLMAAPLAFGAVQPWAWGAMTVSVACLLVLWAAGCVRAGTVELVWSPLYLPAAALLAWTLAQLHFGFTLDRIGTREAALKLATYIAIFFLTQHLFSGQPQAETAGKQVAPAGAWLALAVAIYAFAMSVFAIIQFFASPGLLYGVIQPRWGGTVFGPYVYHNAYAGLMEMLIPIAVACVIGLASTRLSDSGWYSKKAETRNAKLAVCAFAVLICVVSLLLSGSRGGTVALAVEFAVFVMVLLRQASGSGRRARMENRKYLLAGCGLLLVAAALFSWLDTGEIWNRWEQAAHTPELALEDRDRLTFDALRMSRTHLSTGVGMGAFETAYPAHQTVVADTIFECAHDDYAQFVAEAGLAGWILAPLSIAMFLWLAFRRSHERGASGAGGRWLSTGAAIGVCGILVHSFSDFNLHIPANAAWFAFSVALATLPTSSRGERQDDSDRRMAEPEMGSAHDERTPGRGA